jgi:rsbT antagonist protein RsbS
MSEGTAVAVFSLVQGCLVATPLGDLDREGVRRFQAELSTRLQHERVRGVVLDVSALEVMDECDFAWVSDTLKLADLMGPRAILASLSPEVVATLVQLRVPMRGIQAALTVDQAVQMLLQSAKSRRR